MTIRCGVIGAGFIGVDHLKAYRVWPDAEVVAIAEKDPARAEEVAQTFGVRPYTNFTEMLAKEDLQAVSICTPTGLHLPAVQAAAEAGRHVLLEKPMALDVAQCDAVIAACREAGVKLMLGFTHRFHPELRLAKRMIEEGRLGEVLLALDYFSFGEFRPWPDWYYKRELSGGGEMMHDSIHLMDRLAWLIGSPIVEVYGKTSNYARGIEGVEDGGTAVLTFANGATASLFINEATYPLADEKPTIPDMPGRCEMELHGTRGSLRYSLWRYLQFSSPSESFTLRREHSDDMAAEIREFLDAILEDRAPIVGGAEGRRGIAAVQALYASMQRNAPVRLEEMLSGGA